MVAPELVLFIVNACVHFYLFGWECFIKSKPVCVVPLQAKIFASIAATFIFVVLIALIASVFEKLMWKDWVIFVGLVIFSGWSTSGWKDKEPS